MSAVISRDSTIAGQERTTSQKKLRRITMMIETEDKKLGFDTRGTLHDQKRRRTMSPKVSPVNANAATKKPAGKSRWFPFVKSRKPDKQRTCEPPSAAAVSVPYHLGMDEQDRSEGSRESLYPLPLYPQTYPDEQTYRKRGPVPVPPTHTYQDEQGWYDRERVPALQTQADTDGHHWDDTDTEPCYRDSGPQQTPDPQIVPYHTATVGDSADQDGEPPYCTLEIYYNYLPQTEAGAHRRNKYDRLEEDFV